MRTTMLLLIAGTMLVAASNAHAESRYVHLRGDARLVQTEAGATVQLRCEAMGDDIDRTRWRRDCNDMAREVLTRLARKQRLVDRDVPRKPFAGDDDATTLDTTRALVPAMAGG